MGGNSAFVAAAAALVLACSSAERLRVSANEVDAGDAQDAGPSFRSGPGAAPDSARVIVRGVVHASEGTEPVSGAVISILDEPPPPRRTGKACQRCVQVDGRNPHAITAPDGTFALEAFTGPHYVMIEKGPFRRVRLIDLTAAPGEDAVTLDPLRTKLPTVTDEANLATTGESDFVPRVGIVRGQPDPIEQTFRKYALKDQAVTVFPSAEVLLDRSQLAALDVLLLPCGDDIAMAADPAAETNLREFVSEGGTLYVADYRFAYVHWNWTGAITWENEKPPDPQKHAQGHDEDLCSACGSLYEAPAKISDLGLHQWFLAQGTDGFTVHENYTKVLSVQPIATVDDSGASTPSNPRVWLRTVQDDGEFPSLVSFSSGCGRVIYSTFHSEAGTEWARTPQEQAIFYALFQDRACLDVIPSPRIK